MVLPWPVLMLTLQKPTDTGSLTIAREGKSDYAIVLPARASPSEERAGTELQRFLDGIAGARLPLLRDDAREMGRTSAPSRAPAT